MPRRLEPGQEVDGFRLEERTAPRRHGGALARHASGTAAAARYEGAAYRLWRGAGPDRRFRGRTDDPAALIGAACAALRRGGGFSEQPYIVMERLPGKSLLPFVEKAPLQPARVAEIGAKVAAALHEIHRQHVIHFDVKPSNVMTRESGEAVLIDYGLSRHDRLPDLLAEEFRLPVGTTPTSRRSRCSPTAMILAATSSRSG